VVTGAWGEKAVSEAKASAALIGGQVRVAGSSGTGDAKEKDYVRVAPQADIASTAGARYVHITSNETIHGLQYDATAEAAWPALEGDVICDMSSDFLWKPMNLGRFAMVYAGAQKNIGPSGLVVVVARKSFVESGRKDLPKIFQYRTAAANNSLYNTPPTFAIYLVRNVLAWLKAEGGLAPMEQKNRTKAQLVYQAIDGSDGFYRCPVEMPSRSVMNVVFRLPSEALEDAFVSEAKKAGMVGLKGHRSVGGIRASLYNAVPVPWAEALAGFMGEFAKKHR
jgi:phosphoserine aminotransferase